MVSELFYEWILPIGLAGSVAAMLSALLAPALKKLRWRTHRSVIMAAFVFFILPVGPLLALLSWGGRTVNESINLPNPIQGVGLLLGEASRTAQEATNPVALLPEVVPTVSLGAKILALLPWVWLAGAAVYTVWQLAKYTRFCRNLNSLSAPASAETVALWGRLCTQKNLLCPPEVKTCPELPSALLTGLHRPVLYLPGSLQGRQLQLAMCHELAHISQGDLHSKALARLLCRIHWFNPLCHWQARRLSEICEFSCDEQTVRQLSEPDKKAYGTLLLNSAVSLPLPQGVSSFGGAKKQLKKRLQAVFTPVCPRRKVIVLVSLLLVACFGLTACSAAAFANSSSVVADAAASGSVASLPAQTLPEPSPIQAPDSQPKNDPSSAASSSQEPEGTPVAQELAAKEDVTFAWPVPDAIYITREMGRGHKGADIAAKKGSDIVAMADGVVELAETHYSYGNYILIDHQNGWKTLYAHCEILNVNAGDTVTQGQVIGTVGESGNTTGVQCHVEVWLAGEGDSVERHSLMNWFDMVTDEQNHWLPKKS